MPNNKLNEAVNMRAAVRNAVSGFPGSYTTVAAHLGLRDQDLRNRLSESCRDQHHINLRHLEEIIDLTRNDNIAHTLAGIFGGVFLPMPQFSQLPDDGALLDDMLAVMESVGNYGRKLRESLADGAICDNEWRELNLKMQKVFTAMHLVQARAEFFRTEE